jgi:O-antigen ligase
VLSLLAIYFARSEGALAGIAAALVVIGLFWLNQKYQYLILLPRIIITGILIFVIFSSVFFLKIVPEYKYWQIDNQLFDYIVYKATLKDLSGEIRKQQWRETYQMLGENGRWFFGTGLANYQGIIKPYHQEGIFFNKEKDPDFRQKIVWFDEKYKAEHWQPAEIYLYPHNLLLNFWTELGLVGAMLFVWVIFKFIFIGLKIIRNKKLPVPLRLARPGEIGNSEEGANNYLVYGLVGAMVVILVHGIVDVPYFKNDLAILFWVLVAMMSLVRMETNSHKSKEK